MADPDADAILENAVKPKRANIDGREVEMHPIPDQIAALKAKNAAASHSRSFAGLRPIRLISPGPRGE